MMSSHPVTALSAASRREVVARVAPGYREASCAQKTLLLDTVVAMTGSARKDVIRLLNPEVDQKETEPPTDMVCSPTASPSKAQAGANVVLHQPAGEAKPLLAEAGPIPNGCAQQRGDEGSQDAHAFQVQRLTMTIEGAIQKYLQKQREDGRRYKTMEWHQTALSLFQQYLVDHRHLCLLGQITECEVHDWVSFLHITPSATGALRRTNTIVTYARSVRAFCHWLVRNEYLQRMPFATGTLPKEETKSLYLIEPNMFDRLLLACRAGGDSSSSVDQAAARNRAILWVLMDTGMRVCELCGLRIEDVDREQGTLRIKGKDKARWITLSPNGWYQLCSYLEHHRPTEHPEVDTLFFSETYQPLTNNSMTLLFGRIKKRAGMSETHVSPSALRDTFAVRSLQAGGKPEALQELLGLADAAAVKRYELRSAQWIEHEKQKEPAEEYQS